jgi:hypothetical protein
VDFFGNILAIHPLAGLQAFLASKGKPKSDPDTMTLQQALAEPDRDEFIKAMEQELADHCSRRHWHVVPIKQLRG